MEQQQLSYRGIQQFDLARVQVHYSKPSAIRNLAKEIASIDLKLSAFLQPFSRLSFQLVFQVIRALDTILDRVYQRLQWGTKFNVAPELI